MKNFTFIALCALLFSVSNTNAQLPIFTEGYAAGVSFAPFGGSTNTVTDDGTVARSGTHALRIELTSGYTGGALIAATPQNLTAYNAVSFWIKASASRTFDKAGLSNNATVAVFQTEYLNIPVTATWTKVVIPIPNPSKLTAETGLFHFAEGDAGGAYTIWMDDIQYETATVGAATAAMATETLSKAIGNTFSPNGAVCSFGGTPLSITAACFTYTSSNTAVATVNNATGVVTAVAGGTATITATMGATTVSGTLTVNVAAAPSGPTTAAPTPTKLATNVKSLFSNAYTNLPTDTWRTDWSNSGALTDLQIADNDTKKYENLTFAGITFEGAKKINATLMTGFHLDIWTADAAGTDFKVKLVDFGADGNYGGGDDTQSGPIALTAPGVTASTWSAYDLPLSAFMGVGKLAARSNLAQMVIETSAGKTIWIDNVYFYNTPVIAPTTAAPTPTKLATNVKSLFSNAYTNLPTDTWRTDWSNSGALTDLQIADNDTKKYENLTFAGITFEGAKKINATLMTGFHLDIWTADAAGTDFKVKLVDFGADGNYGGGDDTESGPIALTAPGVTASTWSAYDLPLSAFMGVGKLAARSNLAQMVIETSAGKTIWIDNVYFYNTPVLAVELTHFKAKTVAKTTVLNWQTASESKNKGFTIERSLDGTTYTAIGDVKGNGTTNVSHDYTFTDATPSVGVNYYRLRQVDVDGAETLSKVVSVVQGKNILVLKNTLVHDVLDVTVGEAVKTPLSIFNVSGQLVYTITIQGNQHLNLSALTAGLYIIRTAAGEVSRFVKD